MRAKSRLVKDFNLAPEENSFPCPFASCEINSKSGTSRMIHIGYDHGVLEKYIVEESEADAVPVTEKKVDSFDGICEHCWDKFEDRRTFLEHGCVQMYVEVNNNTTKEDAHQADTGEKEDEHDPKRREDAMNVIRGTEEEDMEDDDDNDDEVGEFECEANNCDLKFTRVGARDKHHNRAHTWKDFQ